MTKLSRWRVAAIRIKKKRETIPERESFCVLVHAIWLKAEGESISEKWIHRDAFVYGIAVPSVNENVINIPWAGPVS